MRKVDEVDGQEGQEGIPGGNWAGVGGNKGCTLREILRERAK